MILEILLLIPAFLVILINLVMLVFNVLGFYVSSIQPLKGLLMSVYEMIPRDYFTFAFTPFAVYSVFKLVKKLKG